MWVCVQVSTQPGTILSVSALPASHCCTTTSTFCSAHYQQNLTCISAEIVISYWTKCSNAMYNTELGYKNCGLKRRSCLPRSVAMMTWLSWQKSRNKKIPRARNVVQPPWLTRVAMNTPLLAFTLGTRTSMPTWTSDLVTHRTQTDGILSLSSRYHHHFSKQV